MKHRKEPACSSAQKKRLPTCKITCLCNKGFTSLGFPIITIFLILKQDNNFAMSEMQAKSLREKVNNMTTSLGNVHFSEPHDAVCLAFRMHDSVINLRCNKGLSFFQCTVTVMKLYYTTSHIRASHWEGHDLILSVLQCIACIHYP